MADTTKGRIHREIINGILEDFPSAKERHFMRALRELPDAEYTTSLLADTPEWASGVRLIPDAYMIVPEKRHVVMWEAVHSHDVSDTKFAKMADLSWALDEDYYTLILVRCDRLHREAYDVQRVSYCSDIERRAQGLPSIGWTVPDWQRYTLGYCKPIIEAEMAA